MEKQHLNWKKYLHGYKRSEECALTLIITRHCNLRCTHCNIHEWLDTKSENFYNLKNLQDFINKMHCLGKKRFKITIIGGEPLTKPERIKGILEAVKDYSCSIDMTTNLLNLPEKYDFLKEIKITVSIDGIPEDHDKQRGKGTFKKTYKNLAKLISENYNISVQTAVPLEYFQKDIHKLKKFYAMMSYINLNPNKINPGYAVPHTLNKDRDQKIIENIMNRMPYMGPCCSYRYMNNFVITPDGKIYNGYYNVPDPKFCLGSLTDDIEQIELNYDKCLENSHFAKDENCVSCPALKLCWGLYCYNNFKYDHNLKPSSLCDQPLMIKKALEFEAKKDQVTLPKPSSVE